MSQGSAGGSVVINAEFDRVHALMWDRAEHPAKHVAAVTHSTVVERGPRSLTREVHLAGPTPRVVRQRISERPTSGGCEFVYELLAAERPGPTAYVLARSGDGHVTVIQANGGPGGRAANTDELSLLDLKTEAENPVEIPPVLAAYYEAVDAMDVGSLARLLTEDTRLRLGNGPELVGRDAVLELTRGVSKVFKSLRHDVVGVYSDGVRWFVDAWVDYGTHDGAHFLIPNLTKVETREDQVSSVIAFGDSSPIRHGWH